MTAKKINIAINGFGRIGKNVFKAFFEYKEQYPNINLVALNNPSGVESFSYFAKYDSIHGHSNLKIDLKQPSTHGHEVAVNGNDMTILSTRNINELPWQDLGVDLVLECTGVFNSHAAASAHLQAGAKKVLISAPVADADKTVVFGVNHQDLTANDLIISNASCTTNCLAPLAKALLDADLEIISGLMTTIHSYTNDQVLSDANHKDFRRGRAAALSMIPTKTGAASAVSLVLPALKDKFDGFAIRVPTANVSLVDLSLNIKGSYTDKQLNQIISDAAKGDLAGILATNEELLVSSDFNHNPASSIFDLTLTKTKTSDGITQAKLLSWYDNEWGFSTRMLDLASFLGKNI